MNSQNKIVRLNPTTQSRSKEWSAYAASIWAFTFTAVSFYWAAGGTLGANTLGNGIKEMALARDPVFVMILWITAGLKFLLSSKGTPARKIDGRLYPRSINRILEQIDKWHDAELKDPERFISPLRPHDLRHTFANELAKHPDVTEQDLERLLRHRNKRYLTIYTRPPEATSAGFVEKL